MNKNKKVIILFGNYVADVEVENYLILNNTTEIVINENNSAKASALARRQLATCKCYEITDETFVWLSLKYRLGLIKNSEYNDYFQDRELLIVDDFT